MRRLHLRVHPQEHTLRDPILVASGAILSQRVTKRGSGIYGTANPTIGAYQPKPGYIGKDYFEVEVSYERTGTKLKTTLQANVTITD